jgi:hypothetical protein
MLLQQMTVAAAVICWLTQQLTLPMQPTQQQLQNTACLQTCSQQNNPWQQQQQQQRHPLLHQPAQDGQQQRRAK